MKVGTIIRDRHNLKNYPERDGIHWSYSYYILCDGDFEVWGYKEYIARFKGLHFICQGSDYFHNTIGSISGLDLLEEWYEVVEEIPKDLK